jgi:hypothetical protein
LLRVNAGGGSLDDVNWALSRGYQIHCKDYSGQRARRLAASVTTQDPGSGRTGATSWLGRASQLQSMCAMSCASPCVSANPMGSGASRS